MRVKLSHQPTLTEEKVVDIICSKTGYRKGYYNAIDGSLPEVIKNAMIASTIKVFQYENSTEIQVGGGFSTVPLNIVMMLVCCFTGIGCIVYLIFIILQFSFQKEIADFIRNSSEFNPNNKP